MSKGHMVRNVENSLLWSEKEEKKQNFFFHTHFYEGLGTQRRAKQVFIFSVLSDVFVTFKPSQKTSISQNNCKNIKNTGVKVQDKKALTVVG